MANIQGNGQVRRSATLRISLAAYRHTGNSLVHIVHMLSSVSASCAAFLISVTSMGQQAGIGETRQVARSLIVSTIIGGIAAIICWQVLCVWPSLPMYTLLIGLAGLVMGARIFAGPGMHPAGSTWSYAYLTMIVVKAPAVLDIQAGAAAGVAFWTRLQMFIWATLSEPAGLRVRQLVAGKRAADKVQINWQTVSRPCRHPASRIYTH